MTDPRSLVWRQIIWPMPLPIEAGLELLRRLAAEATREAVIFEALGIEGSVSHFYAAPARSIRQVTQTIESVAGAVTIDSDAHEELRTTARLTLSGGRLPLLDRRSRETSRHVLAALAAAAFIDEKVVLRVMLGASTPPRLAEPKPADPSQSVPSLLVNGVRPATGEVAARLRAKAQEVGFQVLLTAGATAKSEGRRRSILSGLLAALRTVESAGTGLDFVRSADRPDHLARRGRLALTASEVLSLAGWPLEDENLPGMPASHPRALRLTARDIETTRVFARTSAPGDPRPIGLSARDSLTHVHLLGPTNSGKSTAMLNLICPDINAGRSVLVMDPKSDLVHDILERIPASRRDDVVVIDPLDEDHPVGVNPFQTPGARPELIADTVLNIIRDLFPSAFGPRTSDAVHASLLTLAGSPGATLTLLPQVFSDGRLRRRLLSRAADPEGVESFWSYYESLSDGAQAQMVGPVLSRLRQFLLRPSLRRVLDQAQPRFQLADLFTRPRIVLVPLNSGLLGTEAARLLGSLIVSQLQQLTLARAAVPPAKRTPVSVFIDEAQAYVSSSGDDLADALNRSRALGVAWHLAHQFRGQMPRDVMAAIDANCLSKVVFHLQSDDARAMAAMAPQLAPEDFMALPRFGIYASLMRQGENLGWVLGETLPPPPVVSDADTLRRRSAERYGREETAPNPPGADSDGEPEIGRRRRALP